MLIKTEATDIGLVRPVNEDSYICLDSAVYVVADGMGGHAAGEVASALLTQTAKEILEGLDPEKITEAILRQVILEANRRILAKAAVDNIYNGMGTTASLLCLKEHEAVWAHVGDSRIYLLHEGTLQQITKDHSLVWDLVENGSLTPEEAQTHPKRNLLTRAVGVDAELLVDTGNFPIVAGDKFLLCSDGLTNMVDEASIKNIINIVPADNPAKLLIEQALAAGGIDNITAILIEKRDA